MPHVDLLIQRHVLNQADPVTWAKTHGYGDIRHPFEASVGKPGQVAVFPRAVESLEPREQRLGVEFVFDTGLHFPSEGQAGAVALSLFRALSAPTATWRLPTRWGLWFRCKGPFDDLFIDPHTHERLHRRLEPELFSEHL